MDTLVLMFDRQVVEEGKKIFLNIEKKYDKINQMFKKDIVKARQLGQLLLYPYFFRDDFSGLKTKDINIVAEAGAIYFDLIMLNDSFYDKQLAFDMNKILQKDFICAEAIKLLSGLFPMEDSFWGYFEKYNSEFLEANYLDIERHYDKLSQYTYDEFRKISRGKSAIAKTAVAALGCLSGETHKIIELEETQDLFAEAAQLFDDLRDWKEDLRLNQYSWLLSEMLLSNGLDKNADEKTVSEILFSYGYDEMVLEKINQLCEQAMLCSGETSYWIKRLYLMQQRANKLKCDLNSMKKLKSEHQKFDVYQMNKELIDDFDILNFTNFIIGQEKKGYPELKHWMAFLHKEGFTAKDEYLGGDIFQRGFILNLIIDMKRFGVEIDSETLDREIDYLVGMKSPFFEVGWSYYPDLPELSPDIDTLSEMIKIWVSTKKDRKLKEYIDATIEFVLEKCKSKGPFSTWIIDESDKRDINVRALKAAKEIWGDEPDPEVNANFLYALSLLDYDKYKTVVESGLDWILGVQKEEGYWESTWYVGNYYGSYICSKLFKQLNIYNDKVENMIRYLKESQNSNGSWGEGNGNVLDTSYALSSLIDIGDSQKVKDIIERGISYLLNNKNEFGLWSGCDFIKMNMDRVAGNTRIVTYKSATLTSVICAITIVKCKNILSTDRNASDID